MTRYDNVFTKIVMNDTFRLHYGDNEIVGVMSVDSKFKNIKQARLFSRACSFLEKNNKIQKTP